VRFYTARYDGVIKKFPSEWNFKRLRLALSSNVLFFYENKFGEDTAVRG
jgi:hypothetical protein